MEIIFYMKNSVSKVCVCVLSTWHSFIHAWIISFTFPNKGFSYAIPHITVLCDWFHEKPVITAISFSLLYHWILIHSLAHCRMSAYLWITSLKMKIYCTTTTCHSTSIEIKMMVPSLWKCSIIISKVAVRGDDCVRGTKCKMIIIVCGSQVR